MPLPFGKAKGASLRQAGVLHRERTLGCCFEPGSLWRSGEEALLSFSVQILLCLLFFLTSWWHAAFRCSLVQVPVESAHCHQNLM